MATLLGYWFAVSAGLGAGWLAHALINDRERPADPATVRAQLKTAMSINRHQVMARGHAWDVADVMAVYDTVMFRCARAGAAGADPVPEP